MEVTIYLLEEDGIKSRTTTFPFRTEATLKKLEPHSDFNS
jgi:hypothetical protein